VGCSNRSVIQSTAGFPAGHGFVSRQAVIDGQEKTLWVFSPRNYSASRPTPAIVFLHGLFEAGNDPARALSAGLGPVIASDPENWPFITIFPQSNGTWRGEARERLAMQSLNWAQREYSVDPDRVILAGLSFGGLGAWQIGARHADRFAAIVSVSGCKDVSTAAFLTRVPVWAFHSRGDPFVSVDSSEDMCEEIERQGGDARLTVFPALDHDCWDRAVAQTDLVDWMLQRRTAHHLTASAE
jgi:predicted peptidase